ncbi:MAG: flagellin [Alphaproteobacteria bacterium]
MADVTLTAALRTNLLSLQGTQKLLDSTQLRLATGLKVNSALDNPNSFFAAQSVNNRASDLGRLLDGIGQGIQVLKAADEGIKSLTSFLEQAQAIAQEALDQANAAGGAPADQTSLEAQYTEIRNQIDTLVNDAGYRGTNLLDSGTLAVTFNEDASATLTVTGVDFTSGGDLALAQTTFNDATEAQTSLDEISAALDTVRAQARTFGNNLNIIQSRQDFTQNLINVLKEGADKLTVADKNEEGAKLLSLQTTQQLGITSLSLASQAEQSILRLFG